VDVKSPGKKKGGLSPEEKFMQKSFNGNLCCNSSRETFQGTAKGKSNRGSSTRKGKVSIKMLSLPKTRELKKGGSFGNPKV